MQYFSKYIPTNNDAKNTTAIGEATEIIVSNEEIDEALIRKAYNKIGQNVKKIRKEKNFSQLALAQSIGHKSVSVVSCAEICHKNYHFNIEHLVKIAGVLDVNICEFFEGVDIMINAVSSFKKLNEE